MKELKVLKGYIKDEKFVLQKVGDYEFYGVYNKEELRVLANKIQFDIPFHLKSDNTKLFIPIEYNRQIKRELQMIAVEIELADFDYLKKTIESLNPYEQHTLLLTAFELFNDMEENKYSKTFFDLVKSFAQD